MTNTLTAMRQPPPETISGPEQALRVVLLDPNPEVRETAYGIGYFDGWLAGTFYAWSEGTFVEASRAEARRDAYDTEFAPMPFGVALTAKPRWPVHSQGRYDHASLRTIGWLTGWRDATEAMPGAKACSNCGRTLFADLDDIWDCTIAGPLCQGRCDEDVCVGAQHNANCRDEVSL